MLVGQAGRTVLQAGYFLVLARALGAEGYGLFASIAALVAIAYPFAGPGAPNLLVSRTVRDEPRFAGLWRESLRQTSAYALPMVVLLALVAQRLATERRAWLFAALLAIAELIFARWAEISERALLTLERPRAAALTSLAVIGMKFVAACALWALATERLEVWFALYLAAVCIGSLTGVAVIWRAFPRVGEASPIGGWREGAPFALSLAAQNAYNDLDKTILNRMLGPAQVGPYAAGYRILDVSLAPVRAVAAAAYPRFFRHGQRGPRAAAGLALRLTALGTPYGLLLGAGIFVAAPLLPVALGHDYQAAEAVLRWLCLLPLSRILNLFAGDALTGAGRQGLRCALQVLVALLNAGLTVLGVARFGWRGAAGASLASELLLAVLSWSAVGYTVRSDAPLVAKEQA